MKTFKINIDDEAADEFVTESIKQSLDLLYDHITVMKKNEKKGYGDVYLKKELKQASLDFDALKRAYNYYGGKEYVNNPKKVRK